MAVIARVAVCPPPAPPECFSWYRCRVRLAPRALMVGGVFR